MFNLFYTLFKYKEKAQKDELGYYPEKVNVRAFPERRYLWTSRFFVVVSCLSLCLSLILGGILIFMIPLKKTKMLPLQIDYNRYQITRMEASESIAFAGDLVTESILADYVAKRYTIGNSLEELRHRLGANEFVQLASSEEVYNDFLKTELPYFEMLYKQGVRRTVVPTIIYPVSFDFWQVRFYTVDTAPGLSQAELMRLMGLQSNLFKPDSDNKEPLKNYWIATLRMEFNFAKYDNKDLGLINPFGITVITYDLSYMGNNIKSTRK